MKTIALKADEVQEIGSLKIRLVSTGTVNENGCIACTATIEIDEPKEVVSEESTAHKPSKKHK